MYVYRHGREGLGIDTLKQAFKSKITERQGVGLPVHTNLLVSLFIIA